MNSKVKMRHSSGVKRKYHPFGFTFFTCLVIINCLLFILIFNGASASAIDSIVKAIFNNNDHDSSSSVSSSSSISSSQSSPSSSSSSSSSLIATDEDPMVALPSSQTASITVNPSKIRSSFKSLVVDPFAALVKSAAASVSAASITSLGSQADSAAAAAAAAASSSASPDYDYIGDTKGITESNNNKVVPTADQMLAATGTSRYFILDSSPSASASGAVQLPPSVIQPYSFPAAPIFAANSYYPLPLVANSQLLPAGTAAGGGVVGAIAAPGDGSSSVVSGSTSGGSMTPAASGTVELRKSAAAGKRIQQSSNSASSAASTAKFRSPGATGKGTATTKNIRGKNYVSGVTGGGTGISIGSADGGGLAVKWGKTQLTFKRDAGGPIISLGPAYSASSKSYATIKRHKGSTRAPATLKSSANLAKFKKSNANYSPAESSQSYSSARGPASPNYGGKKGKHKDDDEEYSSMPFLQLPSISIGGGGGSGPMISIGSSKSASEDSYSSSSYGSSSSGSNYGSNYGSSYYKKDYEPKPKITLQLPDIPKTIIESNLRLPAIKMKFNSSPFVKVTTNSRDPLEPEPEKNETNTEDIFMKPKPFPKKFKNGTIIPVDENGNPIGSGVGNNSYYGQYPIYGDPYNPYNPYSPYNPYLNTANPYGPGAPQVPPVTGQPAGHPPPPPSYYRQPPSPGQQVQGHPPPPPPPPSPGHQAADGYVYQKSHANSQYNSQSAHYSYNKEHQQGYQFSGSNAIATGARRQEHGEVSSAASSPSGSYVHQQSLNPSGPPGQWYPSNAPGTNSVPVYSSLYPSGPGGPGGPVTATGHQAPAPLNLLPNPYTKVHDSVSNNGYTNNGNTNSYSAAPVGVKGTYSHPQQQQGHQLAPAYPLPTSGLHGTKSGYNSGNNNNNNNNNHNYNSNSNNYNYNPGYQQQQVNGVKGYGYNYNVTEKPDLESGKEIIIYDSVGKNDKPQIVLNVKPRIQVIMGNKTRYEKPKDKQPFFKVKMRPTFIPTTTTTESYYKPYDSQQKENEVRKAEYGYPRDVSVGGPNAVDGSTSTSTTTESPSSTTEEDYEYEDDLDENGNRVTGSGRSTTPKPSTGSTTVKSSTTGDGTGDSGGPDDEDDYDNGDGDSPVKLSTSAASAGTSTTPASVVKNVTSKFDDEPDDEDALDVPLTDDESSSSTAKPSTSTTVSSVVTRRSTTARTSRTSGSTSTTTTSKPPKRGEEESGGNNEDEDEDYKDEDDKASSTTAKSTSSSAPSTTTESSLNGNRLSNIRDARRKKTFGDRNRTTSVNSGGSVTNSVRKRNNTPKPKSGGANASSGNSSHQDDTNDDTPHHSNSKSNLGSEGEKDEDKSRDADDENDDDLKAVSLGTGNGKKDDSASGVNNSKSKSKNKGPVYASLYPSPAAISANNNYSSHSINAKKPTGSAIIKPISNTNNVNTFNINNQSSNNNKKHLTLDATNSKSKGDDHESPSEDEDRDTGDADGADDANDDDEVPSSRPKSPKNGTPLDTSSGTVNKVDSLNKKASDVASGPVVPLKNSGTTTSSTPNVAKSVNEASNFKLKIENEMKKDDSISLDDEDDEDDEDAEEEKESHVNNNNKSNNNNINQNNNNNNNNNINNSNKINSNSNGSTNNGKISKNSMQVTTNNQQGEISSDENLNSKSSQIKTLMQDERIADLLSSMIDRVKSEMAGDTFDKGNSDTSSSSSPTSSPTKTAAAAEGIKDTSGNKNCPPNKQSSFPTASSDDDLSPLDQGSKHKSSNSNEGSLKLMSTSTTTTTETPLSSLNPPGPQKDANGHSSSSSSTSSSPSSSVDYDDEDSDDSNNNNNNNNNGQSTPSKMMTTIPVTSATTPRPTGRAQKVPFVFGQKVTAKTPTTTIPDRSKGINRSSTTTTTTTTEEPKVSLDESKGDEEDGDSSDGKNGEDAVEDGPEVESSTAKNGEQDGPSASLVKQPSDESKSNSSDPILPSDQVPIIVVLVPPEEVEDFAAKAQSMTELTN